MTENLIAFVADALDAVDDDVRSNPNFEHSMPRTQASDAIMGILRPYGCRAGSTASFYAEDHLYRALGLVRPAMSRAERPSWWRRFARSRRD